MDDEKLKYMHDKYFELKGVTEGMSIEDVKNLYAVSIVRMFKINFEEPERLREFWSYLGDIRTLYEKWIPNDDEKNEWDRIEGVSDNGLGKYRLE
jgi:hypothetical protein